MRRGLPALMVSRAQEISKIDAPLSKCCADAFLTLCRFLGKRIYAAKEGPHLVDLLERLIIQRLRLDRLIRESTQAQPTCVQAIFIVGLPRTGTTYLQNLLAQQRPIATLNFNDITILRSHAPFAGLKDFLRDPEEAANLCRGWDGHPSRISLFHPVQPFSPVECQEIIMSTFLHPQFDFLYDMPGYARFLSAIDTTWTYQDYRQLLGVLSGLGRGEPWALKSPYHSYRLPELHAVFPEAFYVRIHRDNDHVLSSLSRLSDAYAQLRGDSTRLRDKERSKNNLALAENALHTFFGNSLCEGQALELHFDELVRSPQVCVDTILTRYEAYRKSISFAKNCARTCSLSQEV